MGIVFFAMKEKERESRRETGRDRLPGRGKKGDRTCFGLMRGRRRVLALRGRVPHPVIASG